jgi:hypothetical protein
VHAQWQHAPEFPIQRAVRSKAEEAEEYRKIVCAISPLVGDAGASIEVFADLRTTAEQMLRQGKDMHGVHRVIDVRTISRSRHTRNSTATSCPRRYTALGSITGTCQAWLACGTRWDSLNRGWRNASFRGLGSMRPAPKCSRIV